MTSHIPAEANEAFASLAALVYAGADSQAVLDTICEVGVEVIPGADHVSISTLGRDKRLHSRAANDDVARLMDQLESDAQEGPCLDSIESDSFQRDDDIAHHSTWPALAKLTLSRTPVRGMIGYRLQEGMGGRSALNVFSDTPGALTDESASVGALFASFASVALLAAERHHDAENLRLGLESNREIGKAIGLIMAAQAVEAEEAFQILRRASSRTNTKLAAIARRVNANHGHVQA